MQKEVIPIPRTTCMEKQWLSPECTRRSNSYPQKDKHEIIPITRTIWKK
jgi:hypothetical protein